MNTVLVENGTASQQTADGKNEIWVTDPGRWTGALKVFESNNHVFRTVSTMKIDGIFMTNYYGGPADERNQPLNDQFHYYDNFIVSTDPITHT